MEALVNMLGVEDQSDGEQDEHLVSLLGLILWTNKRMLVKVRMTSAYRLIIMKANLENILEQNFLKKMTYPT